MAVLDSIIQSNLPPTSLPSVMVLSNGMAPPTPDPPLPPPSVNVFLSIIQNTAMFLNNKSGMSFGTSGILTDGIGVIASITDDNASSIIAANKSGMLFSTGEILTDGIGVIASAFKRLKLRLKRL